MVVAGRAGAQDAPEQNGVGVWRLPGVLVALDVEELATQRILCVHAHGAEVRAQRLRFDGLSPPLVGYAMQCSAWLWAALHAGLEWPKLLAPCSSSMSSASTYWQVSSLVTALSTARNASMCAAPACEAAGER